MDKTTPFAANLRSYRTMRGLTQQELEEMAGLSSNSISLYERGERWPKEKNLVAIADALKIPVFFLFTSREELDNLPLELLGKDITEMVKERITKYFIPSDS